MSKPREWTAEEIWNRVDSFNINDDMPDAFIEKSAFDELKSILTKLNAHVFPGETDSIDSLRMVMAENERLIKQAQDFDVVGRDEAYAEIDRLLKALEKVGCLCDARHSGVDELEYSACGCPDCSCEHLKVLKRHSYAGK